MHRIRNKAEEQLPDYFVTADHSSCRKRMWIFRPRAKVDRFVDFQDANVPTDFAFDEFKDIYMYAYENGLKGCTTFRFNPEAFQGVLVKEKDLQNTQYTFVLDDGSEVSVQGDQEIEYDGEMHTAPTFSTPSKKVTTASFRGQ